MAFPRYLATAFSEPRQIMSLVLVGTYGSSLSSLEVQFMSWPGCQLFKSKQLST